MTKPANFRQTEQHRHQCEVRWCLRKGAAWFTEYVQGVAQKRGKAAAERLWKDVKAQAAMGNTGKDGDWR